MKYVRVICNVRRWKMRLTVVFVVLLLVLHACFHAYVPPIVITVSSDSDSVAVTNSANLPITCDYVSENKVSFRIVGEGLYVDGYAEAIPMGSPYTVEQVQADGRSVTITVDPTIITATITTACCIAHLENIQPREHYHDEKPPVFIPDDRKQRWLF